ncbi:PREDICTED: uncharacterized protein LOC105449430 [Wasmannia auropunctata]|uniref:uncharacterized protein LOC105449430 n=1 Tax=Wasmannia auropunctata TaxID=64793 RepID=UPI0005EE3853|nr:PREDICTED: uncharacterized protein LOC105449430 [Wasmannia auropunctata]
MQKIVISYHILSQVKSGFSLVCHHPCDEIDELKIDDHVVVYAGCILVLRCTSINVPTFVMISMEEVMMKRSQFRLKVDLSNFFHDARRSCWIFVDGTKIQQVRHMKQHISKLFNIAEPFHLLLNDTEYLPPIEDVRILKENETILVIPGSGINNEVPAIVETSNGSVDDRQIQSINIKTGKQETVSQDISNDTLNNTQPASINNTTRDMTFYSVISDTAADHSEGDTDSKTTDNNLTEDCNMIDSIVSIAKRKRVRKRKPRNRSRLIVSPPDIIEENGLKEPKLKKPKIIDSYIVPCGKHIRFCNMEDENNIAKQIVQEISRNESCLSKASSSRDLSTLLALGQSSTPITFVNKRLRNEVKTENALNNEIGGKNLNKNMEDSTEKNVSSEKSKKEVQSYKNMQADLEKFPIMTRKPKAHDIIAFKTLKIGGDYTPQVSNSIFTEVVSSCTQSGNYTLRILHGREEIQVPIGKFSLSEDESESHPDGDTFVLNHSQMIEPRLISVL